MTFYRIFWWRFLEDKSRFFEGLSLIAFDGVTWCGIREKTDFFGVAFLCYTHVKLNRKYSKVHRI